MATPKVLICIRADSPAACKVGDELRSFLATKKIDVLDVSGGDEPLSVQSVQGVRLGVVIGGDGTFLGLVRRLEQKSLFPLLGVNQGSLGFITETTQDEMLDSVQSALDGKFREQDRTVLDVSLWRQGKKIESTRVLNDAVLSKEAKTHMLQFDVTLGGEFLDGIRADGFVVSSATGSTAYGLSAGGPILHPEVKGIVLTPICSHTLTSRPMVVPEQKEIELTLKEVRGGVYLVCDGQVHYEIQSGDRVKVGVSSDCVRLVKSSKKKWGETLRSKLT